MTTDAVTSRKIEAARSVLRHVGSAVPASGSLSYPLGMAFPFGQHRRAAAAAEHSGVGLAIGDA